MKKIKQKIKNYFLYLKLKKQKVDYTFENIQENSLLIIDDKLPEYDKDSGSRRLDIIIDILLEKGIQVFLMADKKEYKYNTEYCEYYRSKGVQVYYPSIYQSKLLTREMFLSVVLSKCKTVWLHRPLIFHKNYSTIRKINSKALLIYDMVDFHYLRMKREAQLKNDSKLDTLAQNFLKIELENCSNADVILAISKEDKSNLLSYYPNDSKIEIVGNIHQFINQNTNYLKFQDRKNLLFVGGFDHLPNRDAVVFLKSEIMPLVWQSIPNLEVNIVGSNATDEILSLQSDRFNIIGYVKDLSEYYNSHRLFIAPLRFGAGVKGKIGQSLEYGLPIVTTDIGAEGYDFGVFYDNCIANDPKDFSEKIVKLYQDENLWNNLTSYSEQVLSPFSYEATSNTIYKIVSKA